jgi:hypothetical protein
MAMRGLERTKAFYTYLKVGLQVFGLNRYLGLIYDARSRASQSPPCGVLPSPDAEAHGVPRRAAGAYLARPRGLGAALIGTAAAWLGTAGLVSGRAVLQVPGLACMLMRGHQAGCAHMCLTSGAPKAYGRHIRSAARVVRSLAPSVPVFDAEQK